MHPPSDEPILDLARVGRVLLAFAERQFVPAAEMEYVGDVKRGQRPISAKTKARHVYCALAIQTTAIQQVAGVSKGARICVGDEEIQSVRELLFELGLQAVVNAGSNHSPSRTTSEIRKRLLTQGPSTDRTRGTGVVRQECGHVIRASIHLKIVGLCQYISDLRRHGTSDRILEREVSGQGSGGYEIELQAPAARFGMRSRQEG